MAALAFALKHWRSVVGGLAALAVLAVAWMIFAAGRESERTAQDRASVRAYEERTRIDEKLDGLSPRELCLAAGGGSQCDGLRGSAL